MPSVCLHLSMQTACNHSAVRTQAAVFCRGVPVTLRQSRAAHQNTQIAVVKPALGILYHYLVASAETPACLAAVAYIEADHHHSSLLQHTAGCHPRSHRQLAR